MTGYRCESGACPEITYDGDTVTIVETTNPEQVVVTSAAKWDAYLDTVRAEERAAIVAWLRGPGADMPWPVDTLGIVADLIERGADLAAGDE